MSEGGFSDRLRQIGPGLIITAAFIGPGTVTTCSKSGAGFGYVLLWAMTFSIIVTIILQEMTARLGITTKYALGSAIRETISSKEWVRVLAALLVIIGIFIGNCAFETGNITGAVLGLNALYLLPTGGWAILIVVIAFVLLWIGKYRVIENVLKLLVALMGFCFVADAIVAGADWGAAVKYMFTPTIPQGSLLLVVALVGTTVVPYNLFLHSSIVKEKGWSGTEGIKNMRFDTIFAVLLGGIFSWAVIITSAAVLNPLGIEIAGAGDMAAQLEPLLGRAASVLFAIGLFAAGITSTITAPLAGAYAMSQSLRWPSNLKDPRFRALWISILAIGLIFTLVGKSPIQVIIVAQAVNGVLLPVIAVLLLVTMNNSKLLGKHKNGWISNIIGGVGTAVAIFLGIRMILHYVFHIL